MKNKFLIEMQSRGYLSQCTDLNKLAIICDKKPILGYIDLIAQLVVFMSEACCK